MATQGGSPALSAHVVGNAFVGQYYHFLLQSPRLVHRFYHDFSLLGRPDSNGGMTIVTTMQAINDKILSLKYEDYTAEIETVDAQESYEKGVIVLVTGCLTGKDNERKKFTQSFFLAPQEKGYFVLNDVFRYVEESELLQINSRSRSLSLSRPSFNIPAPQMATQEGSPAPSAQVVGHAFVEQYYHILHQSPGLVHRFYQDSSLLSRPDSNGGMITVTTMQAINGKILSLKYEDYTAEIKTVDAQESYEKGVIVLVTGCLTGKDNVRRKFTQSFFLAPQDKGYFVLNDVFRYVEESELLQINSDAVNSINETASTADVTQASEPVHDHLSVDRAIAIQGEDLDNGAEVYDPSDKEDGSVIDDDIVETQTNLVQNTGWDSPPIPQEDAPTKKSYAMIVKVAKGNLVSSPAYVPSNKVRQAPANTDQQLPGAAKPAPFPVLEAAAPSSESGLESSSANEEAEGCSIYVRNLPFDATPEQLEEAFKKFGPIKKNGIQVRSNKQGYCFGFVAFEMPSSVQSALGASPVIIGNQRADIEAKRATSRVGGGGGRGRFSSGRVGFRNDSFKGRGSFGGGRGYGRSEFRGQGEYSGRPKGSSGRNGEGRSNQNGSRRGAGGPQGGANRSSVAA